MEPWEDNAYVVPSSLYIYRGRRPRMASPSPCRTVTSLSFFQSPRPLPALVPYLRVSSFIIKIFATHHNCRPMSICWLRRGLAWLLVEEHSLGAAPFISLQRLPGQILAHSHRKRRELPPPPSPQRTDLQYRNSNGIGKSSMATDTALKTLPAFPLLPS